ncbi:hypothetical protein [Streptomyces sp. NPDC048737]|uniref:hypothetical protein n=1 Tax=unclassified Streptomyces TaxID=2593676 RepID=UPI00342AA911
MADVTGRGRSYRYVGPVELKAVVRPGDGGRRIGSAADFGGWIAEQPGHLFAIGDSGHIWKSTTASWLDDFEVAAASLQQFLEQLGQRIAKQP